MTILHLDLADARVLAGSDLHASPGPISTATASFAWACKKLRPDVIVLDGDVLDGDVLDGARISRLPVAPRLRVIFEGEEPRVPCVEYLEIFQSVARGLAEGRAR